VLLLDSKGWPIDVPRQIPSVLDDRPYSPEERARITPKVLTLAPGEEYRLRVIVREILSPRKNDEVDENDGRRPLPIPPGIYQASVMTTLIGTELGDD